MRIGYAGQNGRDYVAIGRLAARARDLPPGGANMQSIKDWIRANPDQGRALMRENLSYVFFKELTGPGPLGALNVPVTPQATVAADPNYVPLGAPIYLAKADRHEIDGLWVAQDTGGAIKGPNRFDTFWGAGPEAVAIAGGMSAYGRGTDPDAQRHSGACARSALKRLNCGSRVAATIRPLSREQASTAALKEPKRSRPLTWAVPVKAPSPSSSRVPSVPIADHDPGRKLGQEAAHRRRRAGPHDRPPWDEPRHCVERDRPWT